MASDINGRSVATGPSDILWSPSHDSLREAIEHSKNPFGISNYERDDNYERQLNDNGIWRDIDGNYNPLDDLSYMHSPSVAPKTSRFGVFQGNGGLREEPSYREFSEFKFSPEPYRFPDPAKIPPRQYLYGRHYMRGVVGGTLGAPGRLKSTTMLTEFIGMACGRDLINNLILPAGPLHAAYFNGEETQEELDRRAAAIRKRYQVREEDCADRLWIVSTRDKPIRFAIRDQRGNAVLARDVIDGIAAWCDAKSIDVFGVDPLVSFHQADENNPAHMDMLYKEGFGNIAGKERRSVELAIHPRKPGQGEINTTISDLRGSGAQEGALRIARVFNFMTTTEAEQLGIKDDDRRLYVRVEGGKGGPAPIAKATWLKIEPVFIENGDEVAISTGWKPQNPFLKVVQTDQDTVREVVQGGAFRTSSQSPEWLGWWMAENLPHLEINSRYDAKPHDKSEMTTLNNILKTWVKTGVLGKEKREDKSRQEREFYVCGKPKTCAPEDDCTTS